VRENGFKVCSFTFNLYRYIKGHGHWVNTLALSSEYAIRTGPYDHKAVKPDNDEVGLVQVELS
jgi:hypothetical protein